MANEFPAVHIVFLTMHDDSESAIHALSWGADGYLPKSAASEDLEEAIRTVMGGRIYPSSELSNMSSPQYSQGTAANDLAKLSPRQREILKRIAEGQSTKEVALTLNISVKTVESHRAALKERIAIYDAAGLVRFAIASELIKVE